MTCSSQDDVRPSPCRHPGKRVQGAGRGTVAVILKCWRKGFDSSPGESPHAIDSPTPHQRAAPSHSIAAAITPRADARSNIGSISSARPNERQSHRMQSEPCHRSAKVFSDPLGQQAHGQQGTCAVLQHYARSSALGCASRRVGPSASDGGGGRTKPCRRRNRHHRIARRMPTRPAQDRQRHLRRPNQNLPRIDQSVSAALKALL